MNIQAYQVTQSMGEEHSMNSFPHRIFNVAFYQAQILQS